ncbi:MAG: hypothetical protein LBM74_06860 [Oscillospiraceae bacterium]|jgi:hypothetical protein|nr:hypothetical protein [Oscillospiraceae bacterium]
MDGKQMIRWVKKHRTELIVVGGVTVAGIAIVLIAKNPRMIQSAIERWHKMLSPAAKTSIASAITAPTPTPAPTLPSSILNHLTGNKLTATELGNQMGCSAQVINKKIVGAGLATKQPCGEYALTETGRLVGESTWKVTRSGHSFSNLEWDAKILEHLFSPEDFENIAKRRELVNRIMAS